MIEEGVVYRSLRNRNKYVIRRKSRMNASASVGFVLDFRTKHPNNMAAPSVKVSELSVSATSLPPERSSSFKLSNKLWFLEGGGWASAKCQSCLWWWDGTSSKLKTCSALHKLSMYPDPNTDLSGKLIYKLYLLNNSVSTNCIEFSKIP